MNKRPGRVHWKSGTSFSEQAEPLGPEDIDQAIETHDLDNLRKVFGSRSANTVLRRGNSVSPISRKMPARSIVTCAGLLWILKFFHQKAMPPSPPCLHPTVCASREQFPCELCAACTTIACAHGTIVGLKDCPVRNTN